MSLATREATEPDANLEYTEVFRGHGSITVEGRLRSGLGVLLALASYGLVLQLVSQLVLGICWVIRGRPGTFVDFTRQALLYHFVDGMIASHLALACLIPVCLLLARFWHGRSPRWVFSVQPGMRWRYLLGCLLIAAVGLNLVTWASLLPHVPQFSPAAQAAAWLVVIVLLSPLQAAGEEFFFRGYLMQAFGGIVGNRWFGVLASAVVFAIFHGVQQNVWLFLDRFAFGLLAGALVLLTGGLEAAIAAHVANNLFAFGYAVFMGGVASARGMTSIGPVEAAWDIAGFTVVAAVAWLFGRRMRVATSTA